MGDRFFDSDFSYAGGYERTAYQQQVVLNTLDSAWDIRDKGELLRTVSSLVGRGRKRPQTPPDGWHLGRAVMLLGYGYISGLLTRGEMVRYSLDAAYAIQQSFSSWKELLDSHMIGFMAWAKDPKNIAFRRRQYRELLEDPEDGEERDENGTEDYVLCPECGAIAPQADSRFQQPCEHDPAGYVKVRHVLKTKQGSAKCPICGFGSFRRFYLGAEAATAVLGTQLFEQLPSEEIIVTEAAPAQGRWNIYASAPQRRQIRKKTSRQFLCFSDSRSATRRLRTDSPSRQVTISRSRDSMTISLAADRRATSGKRQASPLA